MKLTSYSTLPEGYREIYSLDIKKDKKHLSRIFLSNGEEILIDVDLCIEKGLSSGYETDEEFLKKLREESEYKRAKSRASN